MFPANAAKEVKTLDFEFHRMGSSALIVSFGNIISEEINSRLIAAGRALLEERIPGIIEVQPAFSSLCVHLDPAALDASYLLNKLQMILTRRNLEAAFPGKTVTIPVKYGGEDGPDLDWACTHLGLSAAELIERHTRPSYRVFMIGFMPGFPYLGGMDKSISLPRLPEPRKLVPAGSVGIAGEQTGIYSQDSPGGWRLIGKTALRLFSPEAEHPSLLHAGDTVKFVPVETLETVQNSDQGNIRKAYEPTLPAFEVLEPGLLTLVVDSGRTGYRSFGVPRSGPADRVSFELANRVCGNPPSAAALEFTLVGPTLRALEDVTVCVIAHKCNISVEGRPALTSVPLNLKKGQVLKVGPVVGSCRGYIAISGGIDVPTVFGSKTTCLRGAFGGLEGRQLRAGDILGRDATLDIHKHPERYPDHLFALDEPVVRLRIIPGPEQDAEALTKLTSATFTVRADSDRIGLRLDGPSVSEGPGDIVSSPVIPGTIQVTSSGMPVLLLEDSQTTGGYRRVALLLEADLPLAGQLRPGMKIKFNLAG